MLFCACGGRLANPQSSGPIRNFATAGVNLDEVLGELRRRPPRTPDGGVSAAAHCHAALERWSAGQAAHAERLASKEPTRTRWQARSGGGDEGSRDAAVRFGEGAPPFHLLLFLAAEKGGKGREDSRRANAALQESARRAAKEIGVAAVQLVEVGPDPAPPVVKEWELAGTALPTVRLAHAAATLFKYRPAASVEAAIRGAAKAAGDAEAAVSGLTAALAAWMRGVIAEEEQPFLSAADRKVLLGLMRLDS